MRRSTLNVCEFEFMRLLAYWWASNPVGSMIGHIPDELA